MPASLPVEILLLLGSPLAGGAALALIGHRRAAAEANAAFSTLTFLAAAGLVARVIAEGTQLAFGDVGLQVAVVNFVAVSTLANTGGVFIASLAGRSHRHALLVPFKYPALYAALGGLLVNAFDVDLPTAIDAPISTMAGAACPFSRASSSAFRHAAIHSSVVPPITSTACWCCTVPFTSTRSRFAHRFGNRCPSRHMIGCALRGSASFAAVSRATSSCSLSARARASACENS